MTGMQCRGYVACNTSTDRGIFRYDDGNLPLLVPSLDISNNDVMLQLHEITEEHHKISKGITATKLKLDALER